MCLQLRAAQRGRGEKAAWGMTQSCGCYAVTAENRPAPVLSMARRRRRALCAAVCAVCPLYCGFAGSRRRPKEKKGIIAAAAIITKKWLLDKGRRHINVNRIKKEVDKWQGTEYTDKEIWRMRQDAVWRRPAPPCDRKTVIVRSEAYLWKLKQEIMSIPWP